MELTRRHWVVAFVAALGIHLAVAGVWLWQSPQSGAVSAGLGGVAVSLGPAGGAPGAVASESDATEEAEPVSETEEVTETTSETVEEVATETEEATPTEPETARSPEPDAIRPPEPEVAELPERPQEEVVEPEPEPLKTELAEVPSIEPTPVEEAPAPEIEETKAVEPEQTEPTEEATTAAVPPPPPKPRDLPEAPKPVKKPTPKPAAKPEPQTAAVPNAPPAETKPAPAGAGGKSGTQAMPETGSAESRSGGGLPRASADYLSLLQAWLERHKEYPRRAQARRQEGTVLLHFVMDREGNVLKYRITRSSGHSLLDEEVEEMIQRATPLPPMPDDMPDPRLELVIPVQFLLR